MSQLNLNLTPQFENDLKKFMKYKKLSQKSEAVRLCLRETVEKLSLKKKTDFRSWLGWGKPAKGPVIKEYRDWETADGRRQSGFRRRPLADPVLVISGTEVSMAVLFA